MFDVATMQECMKSLLGWKNSSDEDLPQIEDVTLLTSNSGLYFNDYHPYINTENIVNAIPETDDYEVYLRGKVNQGIAKMLTKFSNKKKELGSTKTLLNSARIFDAPGLINEKIINESKFVGVQIKIKDAYGLKVSIDKLGFQFSAVQTDLPIYLFHTSQEEAIITNTITTTKANSFEWVTLENPINFSYLSDEYESGGYFYLGYFQDDIAGQAIKKDFNWLTGPCASCDGSGNRMKVWNERMNWMSIIPIYVASGNLNGTDLFDYRDVVQDPSNNYGMNFGTTIECDLSPYFCERKNLFADALGYQVAIDVLSDMLTSTRANRIADVSKNVILRALEGDRESYEKGLGVRAEEALNAINFDFSMIDSPCLPEARKFGVKKRAI